MKFMPIPREFEEELVFEWLLLKGYSAEVNVDLDIELKKMELWRFYTLK